MADASDYRFQKDNPMGTPVAEKHEKELLDNPNHKFVKQDTQWHKERKSKIEGSLLATATEKLPEEIKERVKEAFKKTSKKKKHYGDA